jgi:TatD DNase family protein
MLVDTHCHLHLLEPPPEEVVAGALAEGVGHLVDVGVDLASSRQAAVNAARLPQVSATAGVHPHDADTLTWAAFAAHVGLARELDKALVVHCREALDDVLAVLDGEGAPPRVVFHCFAGDERAAARVVEAGWYVSFAGTVTFRNAPGLRAACAVVPLDRMVLETDSPFLSPHPYRGRPNRPGRVAVTAQTVAEVHGVPVERVAEATTATAAQAFGLPLDGRA